MAKSMTAEDLAALRAAKRVLARLANSTNESNPNTSRVAHDALGALERVEYRNALDAKAPTMVKDARGESGVVVTFGVETPKSETLFMGAMPGFSAR